MALAMLIFVVYVAVRDRETGRKIAMLENGIDGVNREIYKLAREVEKIRKEMREELMRMELDQRREGMESVHETVRERLNPLIREIRHLQEEMDDIRLEIQERVEKLDGKVRRVTFAAEHSAPNEQKILQMYADGMDVETIAKQLRLGKGEVELVLKFSQIHA